MLPKALVQGRRAALHGPDDEEIGKDPVGHKSGDCGRASRKHGIQICAKPSLAVRPFPDPGGAFHQRDWEWPATKVSRQAVFVGEAALGPLKALIPEF
jgi:hypothetical protein